MRLNELIVAVPFSVQGFDRFGQCWALQEFEDLHRMQREGLGRIQEWRDASAVVLVAKWRALSQIVAWLIFCNGQTLRCRPHPAASWISTTQFKGKLCCLIFLLDFNLVWIESIRNCKASSPGFYDRLSAHVDGAASAKRRYVRLCLPSLCTYVVLYFHGINADISSACFDLVVAYQVQWQRLQLISLMSWTPCKRHM